ncbi:MAG: hypothetical protein L0Y58_12365 [Verrucomicrobia subdivision 3 bacterium]|nr:hypothetical protein [Limisphaerales bacterium]
MFRDTEAITFDWATETYTMPHWKRTITGPHNAKLDPFGCDGAANDSGRRNVPDD